MTDFREHAYRSPSSWQHDNTFVRLARLAWRLHYYDKHGPRRKTTRHPAYPARRPLVCLEHPEKRWAWVPGDEHFLQVSSCGEVQSFYSTPAGQLLTQSLTPQGYWTVQLYRDGKTRVRRVHRLVLMAFVGPPPSLRHQSAHLDGNSLNSHLGNLRWVTPHENQFHRHAHGTCPCPAHPCLYTELARWVIANTGEDFVPMYSQPALGLADSRTCEGQQPAPAPLANLFPFQDARAVGKSA